MWTKCSADNFLWLSRKMLNDKHYIQMMFNAYAFYRSQKSLKNDAKCRIYADGMEHEPHRMKWNENISTKRIQNIQQANLYWWRRFTVMNDKLFSINQLVAVWVQRCLLFAVCCARITIIWLYRIGQRQWIYYFVLWMNLCTVDSGWPHSQRVIIQEKTARENGDLCTC